jgi:hypothetical protein
MLRKAVLFALAFWLPVHVDTITANGGDENETVIVAQMEIFDVSDAYFERLGMDLETLLPIPIGRSANEGTGLKVRDVPLPNPDALHGVEMRYAEDQQGYAILTSLESQLLHRFMMKEDCHLLLRPQVQTFSGKKVEYELDRHPPISVGFGKWPPLAHMNGKEPSVSLAFVATLTKDGQAVIFDLKGQSEGESSQVHASLPQGKTLLMCLGSHVVETRSEQSVPILNKVPYTSRLFKNTSVARQTWHRMLYVKWKPQETHSS